MSHIPEQNVPRFSKHFFQHSFNVKVNLIAIRFFFFCNSKMNVLRIVTFTSKHILLNHRAKKRPLKSRSLLIYEAVYRSASSGEIFFKRMRICTACRKPIKTWRWGFLRNALDTADADGSQFWKNTFILSSF